MFEGSSIKPLLNKLKVKVDKYIPDQQYFLIPAASSSHYLLSMFYHLSITLLTSWGNETKQDQWSQKLTPEKQNVSK